jgi:hypothetical protein
MQEESRSSRFVFRILSIGLLLFSAYIVFQSSRVELQNWQSAPQYSVWSSAAIQPKPSQDSTALNYESRMSVVNKIKTLHALAAAKKIASRLKSPDSDTGPLKINDANKLLHGLSTMAQAAGTKKGTALADAQKKIAKIMAESAADQQLGQSVLKSAKSTSQGTGNTWNALVSRQIGPHSLAVASDWLDTAQVTAATPEKKAMLARAQLAAALARTGGSFVSPVAIRRAAQSMSLGGPRRASASHEYFSPSLQAASDRSMPWTASNQQGSPWSGGLASGAGYGYAPTSQGSSYGSGSGGYGSGSSQGGAAASNSGVAPGLSSYDAEILANGPPT